MNLSVFDFQGLNGQSGTSKGIYFNPDGSDYFDESTISCGIIDGMQNSIQVRSGVTRFLGVSFHQLYLSTDGLGCDFPAVSENISLSDIVSYGSGGSGNIFFRGGSNLTLRNVRLLNQALTGASQSIGIGFLGNATDVSIKNCRTGYNRDGTANANVSTGIYFATAAYTRVVISGGTVPATGGITITTPSSGITIRNVAGWNPRGPAAITVGASPFTYTAGNSDEEVYIYGGTVSSIVRGGVTLATSTNSRVFVPANGSVVVTYSVAPTMAKDIH
jgi:hypothetical protein